MGSQLPMLAAGLACIIVGLAAAFVSPFLEGPGLAVRIVVGAAGVLGVVVGIGLMMAARSLRNFYVIEYSDGLAWISPGSDERCRWDEIEELFFWHLCGPDWNGDPSLFRHSGGEGTNLGSLSSLRCYTIVDGHLATVDRNGPRRVYDTVIQNTRKRFLPEVTRRFQEGQQVPFGNLTVSRSGIMIKEKAVPWRDIKTIALGRHGGDGRKSTDVFQQLPHGWIVLSTGDRSYATIGLLAYIWIMKEHQDEIFSATSAEIPNLHVLMPLLESGLRAQRPSP